MRWRFGSSGMKEKSRIGKYWGKYKDHCPLFYLKYKYVWTFRVKFIAIVEFSMFVDIKCRTTTVT